MKAVDAAFKERAEAVRAFDATYGRMDRALWILSGACRPLLLRGEESPILDELVWAVKSWWGVQGVRSETKRAMGGALAHLNWVPEFFEEEYPPRAVAVSFACETVDHLVLETMRRGAPRREYSLASKVLHWLMPWRIPVFDSFVRSRVGVPDSWDLPDAYRAVCRAVFAQVREIAGADTTWMGSSDPQSLLHALDKWLWRTGGGDQGTAVVVTDPERLIRRLGLLP